MTPLEIPECFPALIERSERDRIFLAWRYQSLDAHSSWSIFKTKKPVEFFVRRLEFDPSDQPRVNTPIHDVYGSESPMAADVAESIIHDFELLRIPMLKQFPDLIGLDGTTCGIQFGNQLEGTRLHWTSNSNEEWAPLFQLFERTVATLDAHLPTSTLRYLR